MPVVSTTAGATYSAPPRTRTPANARKVGAWFGEQVVNGFLSQREIRLLLNDVFNFRLVCLLVGLRARAVHRGPLAAIEHSKLDAGSIDGHSHGAAEGVDFANDLSLPNPADGRVTTHLTNRVAVGREQSRFRPQPRSSEGCLRASMAGADNDDVELITDW